MKAVILAGGKGTRLGKLTRSTPKPLILLQGKPTIQYQFELLKKYGITEVFVLTGYLGEQFPLMFGSGESLRMKITFIQEENALGTAGALKQLESQLSKDFLVLYADIMMNIDIKSFASFHFSKKDSVATLIVHPNSHPQDSDLVDIDHNDRIKSWHPKHRENGYYRNLVSAACYMLSPQIFRFIPSKTSYDFGKDVFPRLLDKKVPIYGYQTADYLHDMGTPDRLEKVSKDIKDEVFLRCGGEVKRKAVFIDRDGVLIKQVDQLCKLDDVELLPQSAEAIRLLNEREYLVITITNQPMIARGILTFDGLQKIHNKIDTLLGEHGAYIDAIYFCPHHPDKGFKGEVAKFKIACSCRKPEIGLVTQAVEKYNIDISKSYFIGDSTADILTAKRAGIPSFLVKTGFAGKDGKYDVQPTKTATNLLQAVESILHEKINSLL